PELVVIGEMKQSFTLELVLQAVDRTSVCDEVWLAVGTSKRGRGRENDARVKKLCRFLGFGLLTVTTEGRVDVVAEPAPWKPRRDAKRRSRIVEEHRRRKGDPIVGGSTRTPQMTAYRQQALAVANALAGTPPRPTKRRGSGTQRRAIRSRSLAAITALSLAPPSRRTAGASSRRHATRGRGSGTWRRASRSRSSAAIKNWSGAPRSRRTAGASSRRQTTRRRGSGTRRRVMRSRSSAAMTARSLAPPSRLKIGRASCREGV